ncbi:SIP domain-containing protein [Streptomyces microflavus]|uniref:SIP domain-containing protein n=1 Tax=Streptomyces microflavus TaxID=1919 RepID=UPI0033E0006D
MSRDGAPAGTTDLLEQAVRSMEWLPGTVCVRAAGEAVTLKGTRRHIAVERQVPREQSHFTGYWRRTEPAPGAAEDAVPEDEEAHERLHELTDLAPGFAIRTAVTLGLFDLVRGGAAALPRTGRCSWSSRSGPPTRTTSTQRSNTCGRPACSARDSARWTS